MLVALRSGPRARHLLHPTSNAFRSATTIPWRAVAPIFSAPLRQYDQSPNAILSLSKRSVRAFHRDARCRQEALSAQTVEDIDPEQDIDRSPLTKFTQLAERGLVDDTIVRILTESMSLSTMTEVQSLTLPRTLEGVDVLAQAKTGTGKTLGFLIPILQKILHDEPELANPRRRAGSPSDIRALVLSPTRELAEQIAVEAKRLTKGTGIIVHSAVGGTEKRRALSNMQRTGCHLLIGTPGRVNDIMSDPSTGVSAPNLRTFVLDEADRMLDQGFWPAIQEINDYLPDVHHTQRQNLMFSATIPREVMEMVRAIMRRDFQTIRTVKEGETPTHEKVPQKIVNVGGLENIMPTLLEFSKRALEPGNPPFKAIIYFPATAQVSLAASIFRNLGRNRNRQNPLGSLRVLEIHARLSQAQRTVAAESFRKTQSGLLFSSDVTARGMDFPNVTHVIQVGVPPDRDTYIHRLGRTARADKTGEGWILAADVEMREIRSRLQRLPISPDTSLASASVDMGKPAQLPAPIAEILTEIGDAAKMVDFQAKYKAYLASLSIYAYLPRRAGVAALNRLAQYGWGLETPPQIPAGLARKLGYNKVEGVETFEDSAAPNSSRQNRFGRSSSEGAAGMDRPSRFGASGSGSGYGSSRGSFGRGGGSGSGGYRSGGAGGNRRSSYDGASRNRSYDRGDGEDGDYGSQDSAQASRYTSGRGKRGFVGQNTLARGVGSRDTSGGGYGRRSDSRGNHRNDAGDDDDEF
ncbi:MAG: hypothetical protein M1825_001579 [Sarcosagium campestre]|nr:MAG: hypothetical protein M1825_001579 [Sarcosagium campestre]